MFAYRIFVGFMVFGGSLVSLNIVWNLADVFMAIMGIVNLIAILILGKYAIKALKDYNAQKKAGIKSPVFKASSIPEIEDKMDCWK